MIPILSTFKKYTAYFNDHALMEKIRFVAEKAGAILIYYALILFYLLKDKNVPARNKMVMVAALGYFILPTDLLADIIPVLGFTDDIAFLSFAVSTVSSFLTPEIKKKAMQKLSRTQLKELTE
ncbi:MAG: hypothetical protein A2W85_14895 [Bacteroidetes bacterium GWF2_41_31]|nr:MAG: hypothetical protein A2W85_14895 [Bacteroidetes bacterium GWF2_41_31]OFZ06969.1 MAG: hypothetical protein A2338_02815 [Bacteroidetes bacterium RIFOXYB12_FULL_41_6]